MRGPRANTILPMEATEFAADGVRLHTLVRHGEPTILILHGLAGHSGEWNPVGELLDDSIGVIAPDQRGHGESGGRTVAEIERSAYVADAVSLIEHIAGRPVIVVGQSMGGLVATYLAASRPDLVRHLVLIEAGTRPMTESDFEASEARFDRWPARFGDEGEAAQFFGSDKPSTPAWIAGLARTPTGLARRFDPETMMTAMRTLASTSRIKEWHEISAPTTLLRASDSVIADDEIDEMVTARPNTRAIEIEQSGHDVHLDQPEQVAIVLSDIAQGHI